MTLEQTISLPTTREIQMWKKFHGEKRHSILMRHIVSSASCIILGKTKASAKKRDVKQKEDCKMKI